VNLQPLKPGSTHGRYVIGGHELTSGDLIEFADGAQIVPRSVLSHGRAGPITTGLKLTIA